MRLTGDSDLIANIAHECREAIQHEARNAHVLRGYNAEGKE